MRSLRAFSLQNFFIARTTLGYFGRKRTHPAPLLGIKITSLLIIAVTRIVLLVERVNHVVSATGAIIKHVTDREEVAIPGAIRSGRRVHNIEMVRPAVQ